MGVGLLGSIRGANCGRGEGRFGYQRSSNGFAMAAVGIVCRKEADGVLELEALNANASSVT